MDGLGWHCLSTKFVKRLNGFEAFIHSVPGQHRADLNTVWLKATNDQPRECSRIVFIVWDIFKKNFLKRGAQLSSLICNFTGNVPSASHLSAKLTDSHSLCSCTFRVVFPIPPQIFFKRKQEAHFGLFFVAERPSHLANPLPQITHGPLCQPVI